ncbi:methyltransferase, FkbM family [Thalassococcus halodurans]|uniref:Methyltransferase, FkbM family n=1 Tax=Thalassococcus halodurans TaxID=373675 RepID=A0A1H5WD32_9RHOB|nr:FkbM family methyltransferase [Thalassococcus halodurans]SEF97364.1 methyltransferase, FkbM family [Thalassococcus halodurans]
MARQPRKTRRRLAYLSKILDTERKTEIVDVGSNPMNTPDYLQMVNTGIARVTGFEPQPSAYEKLKEQETENERHLPYAIGDGKDSVLNVCHSPGLTSLLEPDPASFAYLNRWSRARRVLETFPMSTHRLDDLDEIEHMDLLKIDIQGGELTVFKHGKKKLKNALAVMTEVGFMPLYKDQPLLDEQMAELRKQGFMLHKFVFAKQLALWSGFELPLSREESSSQLVDGDAIFIKDLRDPDQWETEDLKHLALLADGCFFSHDLTVRCLAILMKRDVIRRRHIATYIDHLKETQPAE